MSWSTTPPTPIVKPGWTTDPTIHIPSGNQQWAVKYSRGIALTVTPTIGMAGASKSAASFGITLNPQIGAQAAARYARTFDLSVTPAIGMRPPGPVPADLDIAVNPTVDMAAAERYARTMQLAVTPTLGLTATDRDTRAFGLAITPTVGMAGTERYAANFGLSVTPQIGASQTWRRPGSFDISTTPTVAMSAGEHYARNFNLQTTPSIGMVGAGKSNATFGMTVTPGIGMSGSGNNGVSLVTYSTTGAAGSAQGGNSSSSVTTSWSHTIGADDSAVLIGVSVRGARPNSNASSATCGGVAMTRLAQIANGGTTIAIFGLTNPPTGTQTMSVTGTWTSGLGANGNVVEGNSVSYDGVASFGTPGSNTGSGNPTITIASATNHMVFNVFGAGSALVSPTLNKTQRWKINTAAIQDAAGASSVTLGATYSFSPGAWASLAVDLIPT